jgi:hypothetical protein
MQTYFFHHLFSFLGAWAASTITAFFTGLRSKPGPYMRVKVMAIAMVTMVISQRLSVVAIS